MERCGFKMQLKPGCAGEYKRRHDHIWPELKKLLKEAGVLEYAIWLDEATNTLFAIQKLSEDFDNIKLSAHPMMKKWWKYMADLMEINEDISPVCTTLEEMFFISK